MVYEKLYNQRSGYGPTKYYLPFHKKIIYCTLYNQKFLNTKLFFTKINIPMIVSDVNTYYTTATEWINASVVTVQLFLRLYC